MLTNLQLTNAGTYSLLVSNAFGFTNTSPAVLKIKVADLGIALRERIVGHEFGFQRLGGGGADAVDRA